MKKLLLFISIFSSTTLALGQTKDTNAESPSVHDAARRTAENNQKGAKNAQMIGTALTIAGSALTATCCGSGKPCCKKGIALTIMGHLANMQSNKHKQLASEAGYTGAETDGYGDGFNPYGYNDGNKLTPAGTPTGGSSSGPGSFNGVPSQVAKEFGLKGIPVKFDSKSNKVVLPDGSKLGTADVMSADAMSKAGLSGSDIASINSILKDAEKKAAAETKTVVPAMGWEEGGGGGGGSDSARSASQTYSNELGAAGSAELSSVDAKAQIEGLTKDFNGEPIGIANDSIFRMMTRRYQLKDRQDSFLNGTELRLQK